MTGGCSSLGCGESRVYITTRCGGKTTCDITDSISTLKYGRLMDDTSQVDVVLNVTGGGTGVCCECVGNCRTWFSSLVVTRNGEIVWGPGPVTNILEKTSTVALTARDVTAWLDERIIHKTYSFIQQPVLDVAMILLKDALGVDDPCDILRKIVVQQPSGSPTLIDKDVTAGDGYAGDVFRDMARNVLDFTVIGNQIIISEDMEYGPFGRLSDDDFLAELEVEERGAEAATKWTVNGHGVSGSCGGVDPYLGLIEQVAAEDSLLTAAACRKSACARLTGSNPAPVYINIPDGAQLSPKSGVCLDELVPGALFDVSLVNRCRKVQARNRLTAMFVSTTGDGNEQVGVTLAPAGRGGATSESRTPR